MLKSLLFLFISIVYVNGCYWNLECPYSFFGSKTPYDTVRGDIRDYEVPENCEAVSIWSLNRHGNRNPGSTVTAGLKEILKYKNVIVDKFEKGISHLCTQDIENFNKWNWNSSLDESHSYLTDTGYQELYDIGKRIRQKYSHLFNGTDEQFYFRPTNEQRTVTSCIAFVRGITEDTKLEVIFDDPWQRDDVIRPYQNCDRYKKEVQEGEMFKTQIENYFKSPSYFSVMNRVQLRLGISGLTPENVFSIYEMCRFHRTWTPKLRDPWCAAFTEEDLYVLEFHDDVRHYHRNGYGSQINVDLGKIPLRDLYNNFNAVVEGAGRKMMAYFTHDTMMEMVWSALGLYKDLEPIDSLHMNPERLWRSSFIGAFSTNLIAVLNRCYGTSETYRVQLFINEAPTPICPIEGCTWEQFQQKFERFTSANLDFCNMNYEYPTPTDKDPVDLPVSNSAMSHRGFLSWL